MDRSKRRFGSLSRSLALAIGSVCAIAACSNDLRIAGNQGPDPSSEPTATESTPPDNTDATTPPSKPAPSAKPPGTNKPEPPRIDLHDPDLLPKFELTLDAAAIAVLSRDDAAELKTWVHGSFRFGDITFADVGVRAKGSGSYRALPKKASLKVKFNKFVKGQKLHGLEELTLNNSVDDRNYLRQRLSYHVFRSLGLPAPKANAAEVSINGENYGLYTNVETPDEQFIERAFGKNQIKSLYEAHSGSWLPGSDGDWEIDIAHPDAPPETKPDLDLLFQAVGSATDATLLADLEPHLHTTQWLRYCAAEAVAGLFDHYCYGKYGPHNYFMAGDNSGKFVLLPWSTDDSMDVTAPRDASQPAAEVVFARCKNSTACWNTYKAEAADVLGVFEGLNLVALAHTWHDQIDALAKADPKRENTLEEYEREVEWLYEFLANRPGEIRTQLGL